MFVGTIIVLLNKDAVTHFFSDIAFFVNVGC